MQSVFRAIMEYFKKNYLVFSVVNIIIYLSVEDVALDSILLPRDDQLAKRRAYNQLLFVSFKPKDSCSAIENVLYSWID